VSLLLRVILLLGGLASVPVWWPGAGASGDDWLPITPEELRMTAEPLAPGAPAIYLYRQVDRDDSEARETVYARIKILTEEGRKYADVEIPFIKEQSNVSGVHARTIRPDGSEVNFDGNVFEKTVVKARGLRYLAKTFTLPNVQAGSIIEYRYTSTWNEGWVYDSRWVLSQELFTKRSKFSLKPYTAFSLRWSWPRGLPQGTTPPKEDSGHVIRLETQNVPAVAIEDYMPPEFEVKYRVDFVYYSDNQEKQADKFWTQEGKKRYAKLEEFTGKRKAMEQAVAQVASPGDTPETKLQKIYARCQQVRNLRYETEKTEQEKDREKLKNVKNVEDIWKLGYGDGVGISWLFFGMARAAGLEAYPVLVSRRSDYFFNPRTMNPNELNDSVVLVKLAGKDQYFDPGTRFAPYGLLPWPETGVSGLQLSKEGGTWVKTPIPASSVSKIERKAALRLNEHGLLEGTLTVTYTGLEALSRRLEERGADATARKEFLENEVRSWVPVGIQVEQTKPPDWESSQETMQTEFSLAVSGWASGTSRRAFMPLGLFSASEKHLFEHSTRVHPIYFSYPTQYEDDITFQIPPRLQVGSLPAEQNRDLQALAYRISATYDNGILQVKRMVNFNTILLDVKYYATVQAFFQAVRTGDEQQVVLQAATGN
jgi:hypothetical protein